MDAELLVDVAQVVLDGLRAQEDCCCGLARRLSARQQESDLELLRREVVDRRGVATPCRLTACRELRPRALGPRPGAESLEVIECGAQERARFFTTARAA